ncbi:hypothetical protein CIL05_14620 [Virgibacillus profundi]|uniref:DUF4349 domain-containing protein n=1 Tax=Virgibacillus profundi TaxID=2024555 RepID=A0A2A2IB51_9BACI|nr:DUF4349 domain-containing protein [Virgibacillus profundi]PAV28857.1 hypothetical protein CIL05_14620 [Virgibacillus profundi]PXY53025.1 DUF4349 domain-containing protein [Virgibacillus profundi]
MKKRLMVLLLLLLGVMITACSNDSESSDSSNEVVVQESMDGEAEKSAVGTDDSASEQQDSSEESTSPEEAEVSKTDRKIIYTAFLHIEVKDYQQAESDIQTQTADHGGYIVDSNMHVDSESGSANGEITVRIPQGEFREFVRLVEEGSSTVVESSISGEDVTEEYVDLESRLKSKRVVEDRLFSFMEQAEKTEDLLTISKDLAKVQEEIEQITGRMNYLENKSDLATVTINIRENNVKLSGINEDDLNTWEKTKQQFLKSINFLIAAFSGVIVFFIGNLPILIIIAGIGLLSLWIFKKRKKNSEGD